MNGKEAVDVPGGGRRSAPGNARRNASRTSSGRPSRASAKAAVGLERVRPRRPDAAPAATRPVTVVGQDADGKRVLYSGAFDETVGPGVVVDCSRCGRTSPLSVRRAVGVLTPSLHLPLLRRRHPSLVRCPACRQPSWVRFRLTTRRAVRTDRPAR